MYVSFFRRCRLSISLSLPMYVDRLISFYAYTCMCILFTHSCFTCRGLCGKRASKPMPFFCAFFPLLVWGSKKRSFDEKSMGRKSKTREWSLFRAKKWHRKGQKSRETALFWANSRFLGRKELKGGSGRTFFSSAKFSEVLPFAFLPSGSFRRFSWRSKSVT